MVERNLAKVEVAGSRPVSRSILNDTTIDLDPKLLAQIVALIKSRKKPEKIILFGSRADGSSKRTSDIDIAIVAKNWDDFDFSWVKDQLEETIRTPLKFDVVDFLSLTRESLKKNIVEKGKIIYES